MAWTGGYSNGGYSHSQFSSMKEDAIRRARRMQQQANNSLSSAQNSNSINSQNSNLISNSSSNISNENLNKSSNTSPPALANTKQDTMPTVVSNGDIVSIPFLNDLKIDKDTLMLGGLAYMLLKEGGDRYLILALLYILF